MTPSITLYAQHVAIGHGGHCPTCDYRRDCPGMLERTAYRPNCHSQARAEWRKWADAAGIK